MGEIPTKCKICGNTDINKMTVFFIYLTASGEIAGDATTLSKLLYELKYPVKQKIHGAGYQKIIGDHDLTAIRITEITCRVYAWKTQRKTLK